MVARTLSEQLAQPERGPLHTTGPHAQRKRQQEAEHECEGVPTTKTTNALMRVLQQREVAVIICAAGDIHGALDQMYEGVAAFEAALGVRFERHHRGEGFVSEAAGLDELLAKTQPRVCFFGRHHNRLDAEVAGVRCVGLNKGHYPGCFVAIEMKPGLREWQLLSEWPAHRA